MANYLAEVSEWLFGTTDCNSYNSILIHKLDSIKTIHDPQTIHSVIRISLGCSRHPKDIQKSGQVFKGIFLASLILHILGKNTTKLFKQRKYYKDTLVLGAALKNSVKL